MQKVLGTDSSIPPMLDALDYNVLLSLNDRQQEKKKGESRM